MRVEGIDALIASAVAGQVHYLDLLKLSSLVPASSLGKDTGNRLLAENNYRGIDLYEIIKSLNLSRMDNKIMILRLLRRWDLIEILYMLDKSQLIEGLKFFDKRQILRLMTQLPKRTLIKMLLQLYSIDELVSKMPTGELLNILRSDKLPNRELVKAFYYMDMRFLLLLVSKLLGREVNGLKHAEILDLLFKTKKHRIIEAMKFLPFKALTPMVAMCIKNNPMLLEDMSDNFLFRLFSSVSKQALIQSFSVLPKEIIIERFLNQLPDQFLLLVAAQIDPKQFQEFLLSKHSNLLQMLGQAA